MPMRMTRVLYLAVAWCALTGAMYVPARGAGLNIETATIADLNAAFADGTLTSEQLVSAYLKRIEAYDKQGPTVREPIDGLIDHIPIARSHDNSRTCCGSSRRCDRRPS